jgi:signal transduction histidine kinase/CheY-like chemotaxis protein
VRTIATITSNSGAGNPAGVLMDAFEVLLFLPSTSTIAAQILPRPLMTDPRATPSAGRCHLVPRAPERRAARPTSVGEQQPTAHDAAPLLGRDPPTPSQPAGDEEVGLVMPALPDSAAFQSDRAKAMLEKYGAVTHLTVQVYGVDRRPASTPMHPSPLFEVLTHARRQPGILVDCLRQCLHQPEGVVVKEQHGLGIVGTALNLGGQTVAVAVAGYVLTAHLDQLGIARLARDSGLPFDDVWAIARKEVPVPRARLALYGELLRLVGETILGESDRARQLELNQAHLLQVERLRALGEMAAGVAHDFNNVLAAILGRAELLLAATSDDSVQEQLRIIVRAARDAAQTVRRIHAFTRMERTGPFEPVDILGIMHDVVELTRPRWADQAHARGIRYDLVVDCGALPPIAGDPSELREALTNLVLNGLDAMPTGGRLTLHASVEGDRVKCSVTDTGVGMSPEVRRRVFEPFFTTKFGTGSGLGLSVVYGIVNRHGGEVTAESEVGRGSVFTLWLPLSPQPVALPPRRTEPTLPPPGAHILVVDDEADVRGVLVDLLTQAGHTVVECADGASALRQLGEQRFDVVISDLGMPGVSGWDIAKAAKDQDRGTPVILTTGWGHTLDPAVVSANGVDFVVSKPFRLTDVQKAIARALAPRA